MGNSFVGDVDNTQPRIAIHATANAQVNVDPADSLPELVSNL